MAAIKGKTLSKILTIACALMLLVALPTAYAVAPPNGYTTDSNELMSYTYKSTTRSYDLYGVYNGVWVTTTYSDGGYHVYANVDGSTTFVDSGTPTTVGGILFTVETPQFVNGGRQIKFIYTVKNNNPGPSTFSLGVAADVQTAGDDRAVITEIDSARQKGLLMTARTGAQFNFFGCGYANVTDVDQYYYGRYGAFAPDIYAFHKNSQSLIQDNPYDSVMAYSWQDRTIAAGATQTFSVLLGLGGAGSEVISPTPTMSPSPDSGTSGNPTNDQTADDGGVTLPQTCDVTNLTLLIILMMCGLLGISGAVFYRKRIAHKQNNN